VDSLEAVEVEVAQNVPSRIGMCAVETFLEAALEFAPIDEPSERVVAGLVGHLPRQATQLTDIADDDYRAHQVPLLGLERCDRELHGTLVLAVVRAHQTATA